MAVDGNVAVVGAPYESDRGTGTGTAFVYVSSGSWVTATESAKLVASEGTAGVQLGCSVTISQAARCNRSRWTCCILTLYLIQRRVDEVGLKQKPICCHQIG